jgi:riboflavin kinase / FMN adenylyltransferase
MRVLRQYTDIPDAVSGAAAAVGNFDGIHLGHKAVLAATVAAARRLGGPAAVVTFEPHPRRFFNPALAPFRLTSAASKIRRLAELGLDAAFVLPFDAALARMTATDFVTRVLVDGLRLRHVVVGENFAFGHRRQGNVALLRELAPRFGFGLDIIAPAAAGATAASSSRVRAALAAGDAQGAAALLGHWWEIDGPVEAGDRRGRELGFPTANVAMGEFVVPRLGIYAVRAAIDEAPDWRDGVASVGVRPTFGGGQPVFEVHLFDFDGDLYGRTLRVEFIERLRDEVKFPDAEALRRQMHADAAQAKSILAEPRNRRAAP